MLISKTKNTFKDIDKKKVSFGQFHTQRPFWLTASVCDFIASAGAKVAYDPFAGTGQLLQVMQEVFGMEGRGLDVDKSMGWPVNDSLQHIPAVPESIIITNPPYLAKHSAKRKRVFESLPPYFDTRNDLYQLALDKCLEASPYVVAIVPETILNSTYPKNNIYSITIIEDSLFTDTDCPVCVVCMKKVLSYNTKGPLVFMGEEELGHLNEIEKYRLHPAKDVDITFNVPSGRIALRAVDLPSVANPIQFMKRSECTYSQDKIKVSSRLVTFIEMENLKSADVPSLIEYSNIILQEYRESMYDVLLSPFKGNNKNGKRRRRLDYAAARAILEIAYKKTVYDL